jgi:hypothetical protein
MAAKIISRIIGGIGNQLFSYTAARRLALVHNTELIIDNISGFKRDYAYKRQYQLHHFYIPCRKATYSERLEPFSRIRRYFKQYCNQGKPFEQRSYIRQEGVDFDPRLLHIQPKETVYLEGYWQSEQYFKDVESVIRKDLQIIPPEDEINHTMALEIQNCHSVAVHVRFFDAPNEKGINNTPEAYYVRAINKIEKIAPGSHYFIFSDQPDAAMKYIPLPNDRITLVSHNHGDENAYADLWLMTLCKHFIIANSTFSWWGAWLCSYTDKLVIAPGFVMREGKMWWGFDGLLPKEWIRC